MARYDGLADWYDEEFLGGLHTETLAEAVRLLGDGSGHGRRASADMLRRARKRGLETLQADVADLPCEVGPAGVRSKIDAVHLSLSSFLHAFLDAGLRLERLIELAGAHYPAAVVLRWRK